LNTDTGIEFIGKPPEYSKQVREDWTANIYHTPQDDVKQDWDLSGLVEDAQLFWLVGYNVAQADKYPEWKPGTEFKALRESSLKQK
jgi:hypothetical protein